ncbi:hypothetical protein ABZ876_35530 [Streptomyces sp. NPDC046931]|uniref:hypothetical protein n=1 Tax=Streptomyces sp. NPDC046931 TaxID=3154806 RepID=UPI0033E622D0
MGDGPQRRCRRRRSCGWGTDGVTNAEPTEAYDELCSAVMAGLVALERICPDARTHWQRHLTYGYERAQRENREALASS